MNYTELPELSAWRRAEALSKIVKYIDEW